MNKIYHHSRGQQTLIWIGLISIWSAREQVCDQWYFLTNENAMSKLHRVWARLVLFQIKVRAPKMTIKINPQPLLSSF